MDSEMLKKGHIPSVPAIRVATGPDLLDQVNLPVRLIAIA